MKRKFILFSATVGLAAFVLSSYSSGPAANGQGNRTGYNGVASCGGGGCHGSTSGNVNMTVGITDPTAPLTPVTSYTPGKEYLVNVIGANSAGGHPRFGFQCSAVLASNTSTAAGTLATGSTPSIALRTNVTPRLIEHTASLSGTTGTPNTYNVQFKWTAPAAGTGAVRFYAVINSTNGNASADAADVTGSAMVEVAEKSTAVPQLSDAIRISTYPNPATSLMNVKLEGMTAGTARLLLMDATGKAVAHQQLNTSGGNASASFDVSSLAKGVYLLDVAVGDAHRTQRISVR